MGFFPHCSILERSNVRVRISDQMFSASVIVLQRNWKETKWGQVHSVNFCLNVVNTLNHSQLPYNSKVKDVWKSFGLSRHISHHLKEEVRKCFHLSTENWTTCGTWVYPLSRQADQLSGKSNCPWSSSKLPQTHKPYLSKDKGRVKTVYLYIFMDVFFKNI